MGYTVFRCDNMPGIDNRADIMSVKVVNSNGEAVAVENGAIVKIGAIVPGQRELHYATLATNSDAVADCAVIGTSELMYDERKKNLDEFINEAGKPALAYLLRHEGWFSVTAEGFVDGSVPAVDAKVGIGANGKIDAAGTGLGTCVAIEKAGRHTFYVIEL